MVIKLDKKFDDLLNYIDSVSNQNKVKKEKNYLRRLWSFFISIFTIILLVTSGYFIKIIVDNNTDFNEAKSIVRELSNNNQNSIDFDSLIKKNSDTVGWIKLPNTIIDYPVVRSNDNKFYLKNDFYKKNNVYGWIFADYRNEFPDLSKNTIIYGHNTSVGIMFGDLNNLLNKDWYNKEENKYIYFSTTVKDYKFQIFSVYKIKTTTDYLSTYFTDDYNDFIQMIMGRSFIDFNVDVNDEKIITLSTCYNSSSSGIKLVVHAKMVN